MTAINVLDTLAWAIREIDALSPGYDDNGTPLHDCTFTANPEMAFCEFHTRYWDAQEALERAQVGR